MPQFMLEVRAMARPLIPPGKISLSNSQGTRKKGRIVRQEISKDPMMPLHWSLCMLGLTLGLEVKAISHFNRTAPIMAHPLLTKGKTSG